VPSERAGLHEVHDVIAAGQLVGRADVMAGGATGVVPGLGQGNHL
jgi:hypothetical protein